MTSSTQDNSLFLSFFKRSRAPQAPRAPRGVRGLHALCATLCVTLLIFTQGCVLKEDLGGMYNQGRLGLESWALGVEEAPRQLNFNVGYLVAIEDPEGVSALTWRYELMTPRRQLIAAHEEEMRPADLEKTVVFVQGVRERTLELPRALNAGERLVLWFTINYKGERFHEQLFAVEAGASGEDPQWLERWVNDSNLAIDTSGAGASASLAGAEVTAGAEVSPAPAPAPAPAP